MITLTPRNQLGGIQLTVRNGGLRQWIMPVNQDEEEKNNLISPQIQSTDIPAPMGYVTKPAVKTPSTGLQTANKTGTILPSTDDPESYVRGLNAVTEQSQPTRSNELATSLSNMATASTARNNRQTGLRFQSLLGGQTVKGVSSKATPTDTAWFNVMSDAEKTRAAQTKNPVERGAYINSLNLNDRAINNLRQQQDKTAEQFERIASSGETGKSSKSPLGEAISLYLFGNALQKGIAGKTLENEGKNARDLSKLTDAQTETIRKLAESRDYKSIADYYGAIEHKILTERREELEASQKKLGREHPIWSVVPEGASNSFNGIGPMLDGVYSKLKEGLTGEWTPIDPNSHIYDLVASSQAIQEGANERIAGIENPLLRESAKVARSGASSALTNILQMLAGGAIGLEGEALSNFTLSAMGASAAGQSLYRDLKDGKTSGEAMTNAIATGVIETLTEKVSLDRLIKELPSLRGDNAAELAKAFWDVVKWQAPIEGLEEIAGNVLDQTWDILYSGEDSEYSKRTQAVLAQKIKNGGENYRPTEQDVQSAREQAFMDLFVTQSAEAFASAVFSSFLLVGAPATFNGVTGRITTTKTGNTLKYNHLTLNEIAKGEMFPGTKAAEIAGQLRTVYDEKGEKAVPSNQLGQLAAANNASLINALDQMSQSDNPQVASYANDLLENPRKIANRYLEASELEKILNIKRANAVNAADMPVTASEETFANAADRERTQTANPGAVTLTATEQVIMDSYESIDLKTVQKRAAVMDKIINGENVSMREFKKIKPQSETTKEIFAKLTGVAIPDGLTGKSLLNEYQRGSKTNTDAVAREARDEINAEHAAEKIPVLSVRTPSVAIDSDTGRQQFPAVNAYLDAQKSADSSQAQPETTPWKPEDNGWDTFIEDFLRQGGLLSADGQIIPSISEFSAAYKNRFQNASDEEVTRQYRKFQQENRSILLDGELTSLEKFQEILAKYNPNLTEDEIRSVWDKTVDEYERTGEDPVARMSEENERKQAAEEEKRKKSDEEKRKAKNRGKTSVAPNQYIDYHWAVVPAESLIISNDEYGNRNPNYPRELQPRDRSRVGSQLDISSIAKRLDPYRMTMRETGQDGAPIVNQNGVVISGNGRSAAVLTAYQNQYESAQEYADYIRSHAEDYGLDPAQFPENPVLVRVADNVQDEAKLARDLNVSQTAAYSPMETAKADAEKIEGILEFLSPGERGDLTVAKNRPFVAAFLASAPQSQRSALMDERGNLNIPGLARMENALLAYAYEDTKLISQFTESLDTDGMKRTADALEQVAPEIAQLKFDMKSGNAYNVPVVQTILDALGLYKESRLNGQTVSEIVDNASTDTNYGPNETLVAEAIEYYNRKSVAGAYEFFHSIVEAIRDFGSPDQYSMLGGTENDATIESALRTAAERANEREKGKLNLQLGEGQFGGQSLSTGEDSGGGSQSESGGQDGGSYRAGVSEDVGADVSQADRAKFSDAAQRFIENYDSDLLHEMWRKSIPSKLEAYIWETVQDRGGNNYGIKSIDSIREMTAEEKRKSHIPDIDPALEITWTSEQDYGGRNNPRVHIATIDVGMDAFSRFTEEDENADRTIKFKETPDEFDDFWDTKPRTANTQTPLEEINGVTFFRSADGFMQWAYDEDGNPKTDKPSIVYSDEFNTVRLRWNVEAVSKRKAMVKFAEKFAPSLEIISETEPGVLNALGKIKNILRDYNISKKLKDHSFDRWLADSYHPTHPRSIDTLQQASKGSQGLYEIDMSEPISLAMDAERNPTLTESVPGTPSESGLPEGVGAASYAFHNDATAAQLESLTAQYGHVKGEQGRRQLDNASQEKGVYINEIPAQTNDETYVGRNVVTQLSAPGIAKERISDYEEGVVSGYFDQTPLTHKEALEKADAAMKRLGGLEKSQKYLENKVSRNQFLTEEDIALFQKTLVGLSHTDMSTQDYIQFAADFNSLASYYGKALNLMNLLRKIDPDIQIHEAQRVTQKLNEDFAEKGRAKAKNRNVSDNEKAEQAVEEAREDVLDDLEHPENAQRKQRKRNAQKRKGKGAKAEQAVEEAREDTEGTQQNEKPRDHGYRVPFWMEGAGEIVADDVIKRVDASVQSTPNKQEQPVVQTVIKDVLKFADDYLSIPERKSQGRTSVDRLRDFFMNREQYEKVWSAAQQTVRTNYEQEIYGLQQTISDFEQRISDGENLSEEEAALYEAGKERLKQAQLKSEMVRQFLEKGTLSWNNPVKNTLNPVLHGSKSSPVTQGVLYAILNSDNKIRQSAVAMRVYLTDFNSISEQIFNDVSSKIQEPYQDAEGRSFQFALSEQDASEVRAAIRDYVFDVYAKQYSRTSALKNGVEVSFLQKRLNSDINAALRDMGVKMSEIIRQGNPQKADVAKRISDMLIQQYGISDEAAQRAAQIVVERFNQQAAQRSQETLEKMFREENGSKFNTANQDRILKQFSDLANMGAFTSPDYQAQASAKIFGYDYIKIDPALIQEFRDAETDEQKDAVIGKIQQNVADQIPATLGEKITALRYMGMLGSLKTIVSRNMGGNLFFQPAVDAKNAIAAAMESFAYNQGWIERKTRAVTFDGKTYAAFRADYENDAIRETILNGAKYLDEKPTNNFMKGVQKRRQIFGRNNDALSKTVGRSLEWTRNAITKTMDLGDSIFAKHTYAVAAARYLKAQGVASFDAATPEQLTAAREIAIKEAQEATYRDSSEIAEAFARLRYNGENKWLRFASAVGEGVLPFRKTPANVTLRAFEYSPLGLVKSGVDLATAKYGSNRMSGNDIINELAKGLSGSALFLIGMFLRRIGWLTGMGPSDKKEKAFNELQGVQRYSFKIGAPISQKERYFDVSWMAPEAIPMFLGANAVDMFDTFMTAKADGTIDTDDVTSIVSGVASLAASGIDPIIQMSMLQGVNNALKDAANYGDDGYAIARFIGGAMWSYFTQGAVPQVIQQIPRALHNNRQITFVDRNSGLTSETQRVLGKIPYLTFLTDDKMDYLDLWGRTRQNYESEASNVAAQFLSPTYQSIYEPYAGTELDSTKADTMLWDLYQRTGDKAVLPSGTQSYFTLDGQRTNLLKAEYIQYVTTKGNTSLGILQKLAENKSFSALTDAQKADAISFVYSYANEMGKAEATKSRDVSFTPGKRNLTAMSLDANNVVSLDDFAVAYAIQKSVPANVTGKDGKAIEASVKKNGKNAGSSGSHAIETALRIRQSLNLNNAQYQQLFEALDVAESVRGLSAESLENKLNAIKRKEGNAS